MEEPFEINLWLAAAIVILSLVLSAFFAGAETAFTAASRARMLALENAGDVRAAIVNRLLGQRERFIGAMLIGYNVVAIGASSFTTSVLIGLFGREGVIYATIAMSLLVIIFAELMPKTVAINSPDRMSLLIAKPVHWAVSLFGPVTLAAEKLVRIMLRPFGIHLDAHQSVLSATDEIRGQVDLLHKEGAVARAERDMLGGLLDLADLTVSDVMVHRTKMRTINADLSSEEIVREVLASPYTRLPLWRGSHENIIGVLHAKDLLRALDAVGGDASKLRVEAIVGDIRDEHDVTVQGVRPQPDGSVNVDGSVPIRDLNRAMDWDLPDEEATTIAGLVIHEARAIPDAGQAFTFHGFRFQVLRKSRNRITALRITPVTPRGRKAAE